MRFRSYSNKGNSVFSIITFGESMYLLILNIYSQRKPRINSVIQCQKGCLPALGVVFLFILQKVDDLIEMSIFSLFGLVDRKKD